MTMPTSSISKTLCLLDLPFPLLCRIASFLCEDVRCPPLELSLLYGGYRTSPLRKHLLALALASPLLATAVAHVLGPRAVYLTDHIAGRDLPQWTTAFSPFVKAVSSRDMILESLQSDVEWEWLKEPGHLSPSKFLRKRSYENAYVDYSNLFRALSAHPIKLEVLDLGGVPFQKCKEREDDLMLALYKTFEHNSSSLRELALPVERLCGNALQLATLKRLDVLELTASRIRSGARSITSGDVEIMRRTLEDMLRAVDGHADRRHNISTLRELRLKYHFTCRIGQSFSLKLQRSPVLRTVQTLRLTAVGSILYSFFEESFICRFRNLVSLYWAGPFLGIGLQRILRKCKNLQNIHLCSYEIPSFEVQSCWADPDDFETIAITCQDKLKSIAICHVGDSNPFKVVGQSNVQLGHLSVPMTGSNLRDLKWLLGKRCRDLYRLELRLPFKIIGRLWSNITTAVLSASDILREVFISAYTPYEIGETEIERVTQCLIDLLVFLGDRGRIFSFQLPMITPKIETIVHAISRILQVCATHTKNLEVLSLHFTFKDHSFHDFEESYTNLWQAREKLLTAAPHLYLLDLGRMGNYAKIVNCRSQQNQ